MENTTITVETGKIFKTEVQLIVEDDYEDLALAARNLNPMLTYVRFILTDDQPNGNGERVPQEEFENLISTGIYMPLKMAEGEIEFGHDAAKPLGTIIHLRQEGNKIRGIAALWNRERPADISYIKERYADGKPLDLSWEIGYSKEASYHEDDGTFCLRGCVLRATTLVGIPAYGGRTLITEVDSTTQSDKEDENVDEKTIEELQKLNKQLTDEIENLKETIADLEENQLTEELRTEFENLKQFKEEAEAEALHQENVSKIKEAFKEAGVNKDEDYFEANEEKLLGLLQNEMLGFFITELALSANTKDEDEDEDETHSGQIPNINKQGKGDSKEKDPSKLTPRELGRELKKLNYENK